MATSDMSDGKTPDGEDPCDALDRQIGFACPDDLKGAPRAGEPTPEPPAQAPRSPAVTEAPPPPSFPEPLPPPQAAMAPQAPAAVAPASTAAAPASGRRGDVVADTPEGIRAVTLYALILFAVPTLGVSALVGILAVMGREPPAEPLSASHFIFQKRTLWGAAIAAVAGVILIVVNLGVFVLFLTALWTLLRGVVGVIRLKAGRPIADPMTLLI
jgi:uncharacterized membrane protein